MCVTRKSTEPVKSTHTWLKRQQLTFDNESSILESVKN